jgi:ATP:ADP antiporter, AAA family
VIDGFLLVVKSPVLAALALHVFMYSATSTVLYVEQQQLVAHAAKTTGQQTVLLAQIDLITQLVTLAIQVLLTGRILRAFGLAVALASLPLVTALGFGALAAWMTVPALVLFQAVRRATQYALERPAREALFTVAGREVKYRTKNFMDTVVFRGGDLLTVWLQTGLTGLGVGVAPLSLALVPLSAGWVVLASWLGRSQGKLR